MPSRVIRGEINSSVSLNRVSIGAELTFDRLITAVDDFGRFDARREMLKAALFPVRADAPPELVMEWIRELENEGCVQLYEVDGRPYLAMCAWEKHFSKQRRASKSRYPDPPAGDETQGDTIPGTARKSPEIPAGVGVGVGVGDECKVEGVGSGPAATPPPATGSEVIGSTKTAINPVESDSSQESRQESFREVIESPKTAVNPVESGIPDDPESSQESFHLEEKTPVVSSKPKRGTQCPEELTAEQWVEIHTWRDEKHPEFSNRELNAQWDAHADHHIGKGNTRRNWVRSFRSWMTGDYYQPKTPSLTSQESAHRTWTPDEGTHKLTPEELEARKAEFRELRVGERKKKPARHAKARAGPGGGEDEVVV